MKTSRRAIVPGIVLAIAVALAAMRFTWVQAELIRACAPGTGIQAIAFLAASLAIALGPGLFLWRGFMRSHQNPALFLAHILATGLGCAMLAPWLLLLCGLWTRGAAITVVATAGVAGGLAAASFLLTHAGRAESCRGLMAAAHSATLSEALAIGLAFAAGELLFELTVGHPMQGWDAFLSWDKWAEELAARHALGRLMFGFYPQGVPLLGSLFYKLLPAAAGGPIPAAASHLLLHGFHAIFPLLLLLSVCALSRPLGFNPLVGQALVLSDFFLVQSLLKQAGDADVPLTALCSATLAAAFFAAEECRTRRVAPLAAVPAIFALAFVKGTGLVMATMLVSILVLRKPSPARLGALAATAIGVALSAPFYVHQIALALFPSLAEHSPFHLTLPPKIAHTDIFTADAAHLVGWLRKTAPNLGLRGGDMVSFAAFAVAAVLVLAAMARKRTLPVALAAILWFALWFFTGSYDWRNAFPAHLLACLAAATTLEWLSSLPRRQGIRRAMTLLSVISALALLSRQRLPSLAFRIFARRPSPQPILSTPEGERVSRISFLRDAFILFRSVPFLRDAPHLRMPGRDYRLLANGVRGIPYYGSDTFADPENGDLCFARRGFLAATPDYIPVATLKGPSDLGETLLLLRPPSAERTFRDERGQTGDWCFTLQDTVNASSGFLELVFPPDRFPSGIPEGLAMEWIRPDSLSDVDASLAARFDALFRPYVLDGSDAPDGVPAIRCPFWFPEGIRPSFRLSAKAPLNAAPIATLLR